MGLNYRIEYTNLTFDLKSKAIKKFVDTAAMRGYRSVVLTYNNVGLAKRYIQQKGYDLLVVTVMGFPSDNYSLSILDDAYKYDYDELDLVLPINEYYYSYPPYLDKIEKFIKFVKKSLTSELLGANNRKICKPVKLIIETALMRDKEHQIKELCSLAKRCDIDAIKTNTGLIKRAHPDDLLEDVRIIKKYWKKDIKASGGIKTLEQAEKLVKAGATLIGTSTDLYEKVSHED